MATNWRKNVLFDALKSHRQLKSCFSKEADSNVSINLIQYKMCFHDVSQSMYFIS